MYQVEEYVICKRTHLIGRIVDKEWENGWRYTLVRQDKSYFYRREEDIRYINGHH